MRSIIIAGVLIAVTMGAAQAQTRDCTPPPVRNGVDFGLPCFTHPPSLGTDAKVFFAVNSSALTDEARNVLDRQVEVLKVAGSSVGLFGHSDPSESDEIALKRAEVVRDYLVTKGIPTSQLAIASRGSRAVIALKPSGEALAAMRFVSTEPREGQ